MMNTTTKTPSKGLATLSILTAASLWGVIGLWNRRLMAAGLSPTSIVAIRNFGCMLLMSLFFLVKDRSVFRVDRRHIKYFLGTGVIGVVLFPVCLFPCQKLCSLAVSSVLLYTAPSFVVILSAILWKEPVTKRKVVALVLTLVGCACVCGVFSGELTATAPGILLGLGAGLFYAMYNVFGRYALAHYSSMTVTVWTFLIAGPVSLLLLRPAELLPAFSGTPGLWMIVLGLALFSTTLPYFFYTWGLSGMEPGRASIISSVEVVVTAAAGALVLGEPMTVLTAVGVLCVLAGICILR